MEKNKNSQLFASSIITTWYILDFLDKRRKWTTILPGFKKCPRAFKISYPFSPFMADSEGHFYPRSEKRKASFPESTHKERRREIISPLMCSLLMIIAAGRKKRHMKKKSWEGGKFFNWSSLWETLPLKMLILFVCPVFWHAFNCLDGQPSDQVCKQVLKKFFFTPASPNGHLERRFLAPFFNGLFFNCLEVFFSAFNGRREIKLAKTIFFILHSILTRLKMRRGIWQTWPSCHCCRSTTGSSTPAGGFSSQWWSPPRVWGTTRERRRRREGGGGLVWGLRPLRGFGRRVCID